MRETTLCYIERDGRYLMLHRTKKENDVNKDKWIGVGGGFEADESPEDCMKREIFEETGLSVTEWKYRGIVTFVSDVWESEHMHLFTCTDWTGEIKECNEGDLEWIEKKTLYNLPMWEGDKIFLDLIAEDSDFFTLKLTYRGESLTEAILNGKQKLK